MCAVIGAAVRALTSFERLEANRILNYIWAASHERGRDGRGYILNQEHRGEADRGRSTERVEDAALIDVRPWLGGTETVGSVLIGNLRAEPTTEFVAAKQQSDQQPYTLKGWSIVHNGTIANDKELRTGRLRTTIDSAAIVEQLADMPDGFGSFWYTMRKLKGSFAILGTHSERPTQLYAACNYRPIWYIKTPFGFFFASARHYLPDEYPAQMLAPYSCARFTIDGTMVSRELPRKPSVERKALVVCSGGLDSVVSAAWAKSQGYKVHLIHFKYGSRAEGPEVKAIQDVAEHMNVDLTLFPLPVYSKGDSPLLDPHSKLAGGEAGAEFAHEWVPARNLLLLSVATAFAEARGIETLVLGNNLEEAGAYPDNEPEFIARFNDLLPFAVGDGKKIEVIMPVGNMMKHEIVALGLELGAPLDKTWSCYRAGEQHCGTCGPCYMRRKAFEINGAAEVITYANEDKQ
jgi:7-cyano-7-deazaguanine synthase